MPDPTPDPNALAAATLKEAHWIVSKASTATLEYRYAAAFIAERERALRLEQDLVEARRIQSHLPQGEDTARLDFGRLQDEQRPWVEHNFPGRESYVPLLGAVEELGEIAHAHIKAKQGIRRHEDHDANGQDGVADVVIFLSDYCSAMGWDFQGLMEKTWATVRQRDWKANPDHAARAPQRDEGNGER